MARRPTMSDVADAAGVSIATVDRVLNRRHPVRENTAQRVRLAAEEVGFHAAGLLERRLAESRPRRDFTFLLQKGRQIFYQTLGAELAEATRESRVVQGTPVVEYMEEIVPSVIAGQLREAGERSDAVAMVGVEHPHVNAAVEELSAGGTPVFTIISDLTTPARAGYFGLDSRKAGRTAAWVISRLAKRPGSIGILIGSHRYLNQQLAEISFRTYFREHAPEFQLLEPVLSLDRRPLAYEVTMELLAANREMVGIYAAGGGMEGLIGALRDEQAGERIVAVCNELIPETRAALIDGVIDLVIATPIRRLAVGLVEGMALAVEGNLAPDAVKQVQFPADLYISENL